LKHILFYALFVCINLSAQDTIKLEPSFYFSSEEFPLRDYSFQSKALKKRAKEIIYFSKDHIRIEKCYYYDFRRYCSGDTYKITSDSTVMVNSDEWNYIKDANEYKVSHKLKNHTVEGKVNSLIPFTRSGEFYGISNQNDTLWKETFSRNNQIIFTLPSQKINDKIYKMNQLDIIPLINGKDSIPKIEIEWLYLNTIPIVSLSFIVTKKGELTNIETSGTFSDEDKLISLILSQYKNISPGIRKGVAVNCKYFLDCELK